VLQLGDPLLMLEGKHVVGPYGMYSFECSNLKATKPITLFTHLLHMHGAGARMVTEHKRDGVKVGRSPAIEHYDFDYQDVIYRNVVAQRGDSFTTTCMYDRSKSEVGADTVFGLGSEDEMCVDFVGYYPRDALTIENQYCGYRASGSISQYGEVISLGRQFGKAGVVNVVRCSSGVQSNHFFTRAVCACVCVCVGGGVNPTQSFGLKPPHM
jgi:hypothetical protein